ncbi:alpha/beta fold hydrolase [Streptomyces sp. NBC_00078]|uniref:alpha/beta fold hydrolase n=1 Tax=unclassified Streptomyces TaxID=2593676 RepID=UPI002257DF1B|nr:alpha/beta hydrolase [Streptomyces sp. NBC_00078]MCX5426056.1 alpha/beta hydrolase [Streptomyces sp. NBC_00078]
MPYLERPDARIFFTDEGSGPVTLLLIHGLVSDSNDWNWLTPLLRDRYRIVSMDMRGHGRSSASGGYALADLAQDALAIADSIGCRRFVPMGHSLGGTVAACLAVEHPDRVEAVIEVDPAYALPSPMVDGWEAVRAQWKGKKAVFPDALLVSDVMAPFLATWLARRLEAIDPAAFWGAYDGQARGPEGLSVSSPEADEYLRRRACPVLSFHAIPGRAQWESALFTHPASRTIEWEGSSHYLHIERPREMAVVVSGWLGALASPAVAATGEA